MFTNSIVLSSYTTPHQKICGNTHDQSFNSTDIESKRYLANREAWQLCWLVLWTDQVLTEFVGFEVFKCECNRQNKNLSFNFVEAILVLSASVKGPKTEAVWNVKPSKFTIICNCLQTEIAQEVEFKCVWFLLLYIGLQSNVNYGTCYVYKPLFGSYVLQYLLPCLLKFLFQLMKKNWREGPQKVKHTLVNLADSVTA